MKATTPRARLRQVAEQFERIDIALFTTFNFNADFFQQNVLPALFGCEASDTPAAREQAVHSGLERTRTAVFYDPSQLRPSRRNYRYTSYPVFLRGRFFHAKNIVLFGTRKNAAAPEKGEERWVYLAALSANLTLSGWGRNCEGLADTWIHAGTEQPAQALKDFLAWLQQQIPASAEDDPLRLAAAGLDQLSGRRHRANPEGREESRNLRAYFSPLHDSLWRFLREHYGALHKVTAASPYWGQAARIADALQGSSLQLIAAKGPQRMDRVNLGKDTVQQLFGDTESPPLWSWQSPDARFFHIKLYQVSTRTHQVIGLGSCNFTEPGQFWRGENGNASGNVEAMLFDEARFDFPARDALQLAQMPQASLQDDAPQALPCYVNLIYDWKEKLFHWQLEPPPCGEAVTLHLPGGQAVIALDSAHPAGECPGVLASTLFVYDYRGQSYTGSVIETQLDYSEHRYGTALDALDILESWRSGATAEPPPPEQDPAAPAGDAGNNAANTEAKLDWFEFYRALAAMRGRLDQAGTDPHRLGEWLYARRDSVVALAEQVLAQPLAVVARWLVVHECTALLDQHARLPKVAARLDLLKRRLEPLREQLLDEIRRSLHSRGKKVDETGLLDWYVDQLRSTA